MSYPVPLGGGLYSAQGGPDDSGPTNERYLGDDGCSSWELPPNHIWVVAVRDDTQDRVEALFSQVENAWAFADEWNREREPGRDPEAYVDYQRIDPPFPGF